MRKTSKILVVLLTLCLLFGAITAISASAEDETVTPGGDVIGTTLSGTAKGNVTSNKPFDGLSSNKFSQNAYLAIDVDFAATKDSTGSYTFPAGLYFQHNAMYNTAGKNLYVSQATVNGELCYYLGSATNATAAEQTAERKISGEAGVYNHLTVFFKYNAATSTAAAYVDTYIYLNGKFVEHATTTSNITAPGSFAIKSAKTANWTTTTSVDYHITGSLYTEGSAKATALAGIIESGAPLYSYAAGTPEYNAVMYNEDYNTRNEDTFVIVNGKKYYIVEAGINKLYEAKANLTLFSDMTQFNLYVKKVDGLTLKSYSAASGGDANSSVKDNHTDENWVFYWGPRFDRAMKAQRNVDVTLNFSYTFNDGTADKTVEFTKVVTLDPIKYTALVAEQFPCGSDEAILVRAITDFRKQALIYAGQYSSESNKTTVDDWLAPAYAAFEKHGANCACTEAPVAEEGTNNTPVLPEGYESLEDIPTYDGTVGFVLCSSANNSWGLYLVNETDAGAEFSVSYAYLPGTMLEGQAAKATVAGGKFYVKIPAAYLDNTFIIAVGSTNTTYYKYSLDDYIGTLEEGTTAYDLAMALKDYVIAAENYKIYKIEK